MISPTYIEVIYNNTTAMIYNGSFYQWLIMSTAAVVTQCITFVLFLSECTTYNEDIDCFRMGQTLFKGEGSISFGEYLNFVWNIKINNNYVN